MTMPGADSAIARVVSKGSAVPVGLFGEVSSTISGCSTEISSVARATSIVKSSVLGAVIHRVCVSRAYSGYIEYVGVNDNADRPGPANAWNSWVIISLDPLAAHMWSALRP